MPLWQYKWSQQGLKYLQIFQDKGKTLAFSHAAIGLCIWIKYHPLFSLVHLKAMLNKTMKYQKANEDNFSA